MAFDIKYLARINTSANDAVQKMWAYNGDATGSNEPVATITTSGYFNPAQQNLTNGVGILQVNDLFVIHGNDASAFYLVTAVSPTVTLSPFAASGTIGTGNIQDEAVTTPKIADDAVTTDKIADGSVTFAKLDDDIAPSHVIKFAAQHTTVGGNVDEGIAVTGALATDLAFVQLVDEGTNTVTVTAAVVSADTLTVTFSADPGADAVINYELIRATA